MIKVHCPQCNVRLSAPDDYLGRPVTCQKCSTKFILSRRWASEPLTSADRADRADRAGSRANDANADLTLDATLPKPIGVAVAATSSPVAASAATGATASTATPASVLPAAMTSGAGREDSREGTAAAIPMGIIPTAAMMGGGTDEADQASFSAFAAAQAESFGRGSGADDGQQTLGRFVEAESIMDLFDFRFRRYLTPMILRISWVLVLISIAVWSLFVSFVYVWSLLPDWKPTASDISQRDAVEAPFAIPANLAEADEVDEEPRWQFPDWFVKSMSWFLFQTLVYVTTMVLIFLSLLWLRVVFEMMIVLFGMAKSLDSMNQRSEQES